MQTQKKSVAAGMLIGLVATVYPACAGKVAGVLALRFFTGSKQSASPAA